MGCDGGTIPRRDELVRVQKKPEQKDKDSEREFRWLHCALTQQRLQEPIVMCGLGRLYSKQNIIEQLLEKDKMPESAKHIKSMKDIKTLTLTPNPAYTDEDKLPGLLDARHAPYICKFASLEMSGKFRFVALWSCGCVMSERALKQIKNTNAGVSVCPLCQTPFAIYDVIVLNGGDEDLEMMQAKIEMRQAKRKSEKKAKKESKIKVETVTNGEEAKPEEGNDEKPDVKLENGDSEKPTTSEAVNGKVAPASTIVSNNKSKIKVFARPKRFGGSNDPLQDPDLKRLKTDYSVAKDPKATDVYKSLFTSHKTEQEQDRAHWVTYNPFYN